MATASGNGRADEFFLSENTRRRGIEGSSGSSSSSLRAGRAGRGAGGRREKENEAEPCCGVGVLFPINGLREPASEVVNILEDGADEGDEGLTGKADFLSSMAVEVGEGNGLPEKLSEPGRGLGVGACTGVEGVPDRVRRDSSKDDGPSTPQNRPRNDDYHGKERERSER